MDSLDRIFSALSNPTRRAILDRLRDGEATVNELAEPFDMTQPAISRHLKVLEKAGLITRGRDAQRRPCRLAPGSLAHAVTWLGGHVSEDEERFPRIDRLLQKLTALDARLGRDI